MSYVSTEQDCRPSIGMLLWKGTTMTRHQCDVPVVFSAFVCVGRTLVDGKDMTIPRVMIGEVYTVCVADCSVYVVKRCMDSAGLHALTEEIGTAPSARRHCRDGRHPCDDVGWPTSRCTEGFWRTMTLFTSLSLSQAALQHCMSYATYVNVTVVCDGMVVASLSASLVILLLL